MKRLVITTLLMLAAVVAQSGPCCADGNVNAVRLDDTLFLVGDSEGNTLVVWSFIPDSGAPYVVVFGRTPEASELPHRTTSTINGGTQPILFENVSNLVVLTAGGDDFVHLDGPIAGDVAADTGTGNDRVSLFPGNLTIGGEFLLNTGPGLDSFEAESVWVAGATHVNTESGNDSLFLSFHDNFAGGLTIDTGANDDVVRFASSLSGGTTMEVGVTLEILLGTGKDTLELPSAGSHVFVDGDATLSGDQGVDALISVFGIVVTGNLQILDFE